MSMRVDGYSVWCDATDCLEWVGQQATRREARAAAKADGWERRRMIGGYADYCPLHRSKNPAKGGYVSAEGRVWL
jgi:hypothetical protein